MTGEMRLRASIALLGAVAFSLGWLALIAAPVTGHWLMASALGLALAASILNAVWKGGRR